MDDMKVKQETMSKQKSRFTPTSLYWRKIKWIWEVLVIAINSASKTISLISFDSLVSLLDQNWKSMTNIDKLGITRPFIQPLRVLALTLALAAALSSIFAALPFPFVSAFAFAFVPFGCRWENLVRPWGQCLASLLSSPKTTSGVNKFKALWRVSWYQEAIKTYLIKST